MTCESVCSNGTHDRAENGDTDVSARSGFGRGFRQFDPRRVAHLAVDVDHSTANDRFRRGRASIVDRPPPLLTLADTLPCHNFDVNRKSAYAAMVAASTMAPERTISTKSDSLTHA